MNKPKYLYTGEVKQQVESFRNHLQKRHMGKDSTRKKTNYTGYFLTWLETEHLQPQDTRYNDLLNFINYCRLDGKSKTLINLIIASIRNYYQFLKQETPTITNPAANLYLKGERHKILSGIIHFNELENLYKTHKTATPREKRNKIILGLLIYQAISVEELGRLEPGHIKLKEGKIHILGNRRRNSRVLGLKPFQVMELHEYITEIRPKILAEINLVGGWKPKPSRKPDRINKTRIENQLFISINGSEHIKNSLVHLFKDAQKINPDITNAKQIRQSTITYWLKTHNLREVQYMAGHKYVSSTERYQANNLESLKEKLDKYHPLRDN